MRRTRKWWILLAGIVPLAAGLWCLQTYRPHPQFAFLGGQSPVFGEVPPMPGFVADVYSFPARMETVHKQALKELSAKGYRFDCWTVAPSLQGAFNSKATVSGWPACSVVITSGRTTGKRFDIDGDSPTHDKDPNWTTVEVFSPDPLPALLRDLVGY